MMNFEVNSENNIVRAIAEGKAPKTVQLAASNGALPLPQIDLLEALVILAGNEDKEIAASAEKTLKSQDNEQLKSVIISSDVAPRVLDYFATQETLSQEIYEVVISNPNTPNESIVKFAKTTMNGELLEAVSLNQQLLINTPELIDAILNNPMRTSEADRRASEIKKEFFEKERGAKQIADELRAQGKEAAAEFIEEAEFADELFDKNAESEMSVDDALFLAEHIEVPDDEIDDSWLSLEYIEEIYEETPEERQAAVSKIVGEMKDDEDDEVSGKRISMVQKIMSMGMKDRVKFASKGDRESRNVLVRDPNKIVAQAVIKNPKITEQEVEKISTMKTVPEDVLRLIAMDKKFARNYVIIHNLAKNARTPIGNVISILTRLQLHDLVAMEKNRNVPDAVRKQAKRLVNARKGK